MAEKCKKSIDESSFAVLLQSADSLLEARRAAQRIRVDVHISGLLLFLVVGLLLLLLLATSLLLLGLHWWLLFESRRRQLERQWFARNLHLSIFVFVGWRIGWSIGCSIGCSRREIIVGLVVRIRSVAGRIRRVTWRCSNIVGRIRRVAGRNVAQSIRALQRRFS